MAQEYGENIYTLHGQVSCNTTDIRNLQRWQKDQNGTLREIRSELKELREMFSSFYRWLAGLAIVWLIQVIITVAMR